MYRFRLNENESNLKVINSYRKLNVNEKYKKKNKLNGRRLKLFNLNDVIFKRG